MVLNARKVYQPGKKIQHILLAIEDITERAKPEREHAAVRMMHRQHVAARADTPGLNSLQFIAAMVERDRSKTHTSGARAKRLLRGYLTTHGTPAISIQSCW